MRTERTLGLPAGDVLTHWCAFDGAALIAALNSRRVEHELDSARLADVLWAQTPDLNAEPADHCLCSCALVRTAKRGTISCQYALILLRWIGRAPEDFLTGPVIGVGDTTLPDAGADRRLRFDLAQLYATLNQARQDRGLTWAALADTLGADRRPPRRGRGARNQQ